MSTTFVDEVELTAEVVDLVADRASASDLSGHLDPDVVAALRATGINRLLLPASWAGWRRRPGGVWRSSSGSPWRTAAPRGQRRSGSAPICSPATSTVTARRRCSPIRTRRTRRMFAPMAAVTRAADGSLRLTGRWPFTSNCEQAAWLGLAAAFPDEPAPGLVFAPRDAVTIHPTWDVTGLRATASNDTSLTDFAVDRRHTCSFGDRPWADGPLWRLPLFVALAPTLAAVGLGVARGALDAINGQALARVAQMRGSLLDDHVGMGDLGAADALLRGARAGLLDALDACWTRAEVGDPIDRRLQARTFLASQHCLDVAVEVAGTCHRLGGGAAAYRSSPLLRAVRDVETARQHAMFNRGLRSHLARVIAGSDEVHPPFVV